MLSAILGTVLALRRSTEAALALVSIADIFIQGVAKIAARARRSVVSRAVKASVRQTVTTSAHVKCAR